VKPRQGAVINNTDFAGYAATPKSGGASAFKYVTASFTVPSLNCPSAGNGDLQLANLGSNGVLNFGYAIGVTSVCQQGYVQYQGWYWTPSGAHGAIDVNPGDAVTSSVFYNSTNKTYTLKLLDHTTGQKTDVTQKSSVMSTVAEVVTVGEGSSNDGMADFAAVHFDTIKVDDTTRGRFVGFSANVSHHHVLQERAAGGRHPTLGLHAHPVHQPERRLDDEQPVRNLGCRSFLLPYGRM
jgi:Peptidase A4 family